MISHASFEKKYSSPVRAWLMLGVAALALAGLFAVILVAARAPAVQELLPFEDAFRAALVIHVNLSVLVWLLCAAGFVFNWRLSATRAAPLTPPPAGHNNSRPTAGGVASRRFAPPGYLHCFTNILERTALILAASGALMLALSPFLAPGEPLLNNYVPVLTNKPFFIGLTLFGTGIALQAALFILRAASLAWRARSAEIFALICTHAMVLMALAGFFLAYGLLSRQGLAGSLAPQEYYELLFWGGGHILQFAYAQLMLIAWWKLADASGWKTGGGRLFALAALINLLIAMAALQSFGQQTVQRDITDPEYAGTFTWYMIYGGGVAPVLVFLALLRRAFLTRKHGGALWRQGEAYPISYLFWSLALFAAGGWLGFSIQGSDTVIPAHYHGSIVGVTIALMGTACVMLPQLGWREVSGRLPVLQPALYGGGQLLHIVGLAWSGGYGALRKTPGAMQSLEGQAAMGFMGLGGLLSVLGGLLFVWICVRSMWLRGKNS